jgi:hypothetical protein
MRIRMRREDEDDNEDLSGLLVMAKKCIQIEDQLYTVITVIIRPEGVQQQLH